MPRLRLQAEPPSAPGDGLRFVTRQSDIVDEAVRVLWEAAGLAPSDGIALVALGGYGRREICPFSDVDLMLLHSWTRSQPAGRVAKDIFYPFWDAGIEVGHATRSARDCLRLARQDINSLTSLLDARYLAGDEELFRRLSESILRLGRKRKERFIAESVAATEQRRARYGEGAYLLEPDLKDGWGGLRDIHQMMWAGKLLGARELSGLGDEGYLSERNVNFLAEAFDRLLTVRVRLHLSAGRKGDRLLRERQAEVAQALGYSDLREETGPDRFMRDQHETAARVHSVSTLFWSRLRGPVSGFGSADTSSAGKVMKLLGETARDGGELAADLAERIQDRVQRLPEHVEWDADLREGFVELLRAGERGTKLLEFANECDLISRCLPAWGRIRYRPASGAYHRFTVDMHSFQTVAELADFSSGQDELLGQIGREFDNEESLLVAALLHDIGKGEPNHSQAGGRIAGELCRDTGFADPELVSFLVREHLLLYETATRRDFSEELFLTGLSERIGSARRLKMLYLLTAADSMATGEGAWSEWRQVIVRELFFKLLELLEPGSAGKSRRETAREAAEDEELAEIASFVEQLPDSYFTGAVIDAVQEHFRLVRDASPAGLKTLVRPARMKGVTELSLAVTDRPGLLAKVAGVLALHGRNILSAETYSLSDGMALEIFLTTPYFERRPEEEDWQPVVDDLHKVMDGRMALDYRMARKTKAYATKSSSSAETRIDNDSSESCTIIEVHADDRIGLLFTIASALRDLELNIRIAKVATAGDKAVDVFYVVGAGGKKVLDETRLEEISRSIEYRVGL